jgi:RNA polymerase sigma-70 factor (ECF subfamily)
MSAEPSLAAVFVGALPPPTQPEWSSLPDLEAALRRAVTAARPPADVAVPSASAYVTGLATRLASRPAAIQSIDALDHATLAWVDACAAGDPVAAAAFLTAFTADLDKAITRTRAPAQLIGDIRQIVLAKLLPPGRRIAQYSGHGALRNWLRAVAVHEAISVLRSADAPVDELPTALLASTDPERAAIRDDAREHLQAALHEAFAALDDEDRIVLRHRFADGLTLDQLALALGVHRATAARWLARIRDDLSRAVRRRLEAQGLRRTEIEQLLVVSHLELSLGGLLGRPPEPPPP